MQDRSEDADLRIADGSWWPGEGGGWKKAYQTGGSSSILPAKKIEDGGVLYSSAEKVEDRGASSYFGGESPTPPSSVRSSTHSSRPTIEDGGVFGLRLRRSNVIERKRRPTGKNTATTKPESKQTGSEVNTSHTAEACRLRAGRRAT